MNMIQKMYNCVVPGHSGEGYQVSAWQAMGSNTVCMRTKDNKYGWSEDMTLDYGVPAVMVEKLSDYAHHGVRTMDDLVDFLFYVVKA